MEAEKLEALATGETEQNGDREMSKSRILTSKVEIKTSREIAHQWDIIIKEAPGATYEDRYKTHTEKRNKKWASVDDLKRWLIELDGMYCLSEFATGEKCDRYKTDEICGLKEDCDCDFRSVRVKIREFLEASS